MGFPNLVLPFNEGLIGRLTGRALVVRVADPALLTRVAGLVEGSGNRLSAIILDSNVALDQVPFTDEWKDLTLTVFAPSMGLFRDLVGKLETIRAVNPLICLPAGTDENVSALRILASVNVRCGAVISDGPPIDWEGLSDLMTYALIGTAPHAAVEPFASIRGRYRSTGWVGWGQVFFDNPADFFHVDGHGRVALSRRELLAGQFIADDIDRLDEIVVSEDYRDRTDLLRRFFLTYHPCSRCPGWRVCLGRFSDNDDLADCSSFFTEMIDLLQHYQPPPQAPHKERHDHRHL